MFFKAPATPQPATLGQKVVGLFPFGAPTPTAPASPTSGTISTTPEPANPEQIVTPITTLPKLQQVSTMPVAGFIFKADTNVLRYVNKSTGIIYENSLSAPAEKPISTTVIPKIEEAFWGNAGNSVILRYLDKNNIIESFAGQLAKTATADNPENLSGNFLNQNISDVAVSPDQNQLFYLFTYNSSAVGTTAKFDGSKQSQVFSSPFTEWISGWPSARLITLTTKASALSPGFMFRLDPQTKSLSKVFGDISGLATLMNPNGKSVLYSQSASNSLNFSLYGIAGQTSLDLGLKTLPEKCVWSKDGENVYCLVPKGLTSGNYPDIWYQGLISFSDQLWKINTKNNTDTLLVDPAQVAGQEIDGIKPVLDEKETHLFFLNKKDSSLWSYSLQ
jgi:hypothetical protein